MTPARWLLPSALLAWAASAHTAPPPDAAALARCEADARGGLYPPAARALARMPDTGRRLLALRGYLRARDMASRWSWDEARIRAYDGSAEQARAQAAVARVQAAFAAANPGYRLYVNPQVRSLEVQLAHWNANASVGDAAAALAGQVVEGCGARTPFADWLRRWQPPRSVSLSVPGLSPHGQAQAIDFQVYAGNRLVAGTDTRAIATAWRVPGWDARLLAAVSAADAGFQGPLASPDEPWHYAWRGQRAAGATNP